MSLDLQRIQHIRDYCIVIAKTIERYGNSFVVYEADPLIINTQLVSQFSKLEN